MSDRTVLVVGAQGVVGRAVMDHCAKLGIRAVGVGRRPAASVIEGEYRAVDMLDRADCEAGLGDLTEVTDIVFSAWQRGATRLAEVEPNLRMLANAVDTIDRVAPGLRHVTLLQGVKAYGSHLGDFRQPARETDPRHFPPNFYYDQEDYLRALAAERAWSWTVFRPVTVCGVSERSSMSMTIVIAVHAALCKANGLPLRFPGTRTSYEALRQMVDADLLAEAILWSGRTDAARDQIFNVTNGDVVRWSHLWPAFADWFGMPLAEPHAMPLAAFMAGQGPTWQRLVERHGLSDTEYAAAAPWAYAEDIFTRSYGNLLNTNKLRAAGFDGFADTEAMFRAQFERLAAARLIPPLTG